jgi:hypothetical protein
MDQLWFHHRKFQRWKFQRWNIKACTMQPLQRGAIDRRADIMAASADPPP